jgi:glycosyltransferase involved in cell wall biosynthesis
MRIAYMLTSLGIGGAEKQAIAIGERMAARGHDVALIVLRPPEEHEWPTKLTVIYLGINKSLPSVVSGVMHARRVFHSFNPHLLHSHTFPANMMARTLHAIGAVPAVLSTIHNVYEGGRHRTLAYRMTDPFSTLSTAVSQAVADRYIEIRAVPRCKCSVISNGIDTDLFSPSRWISQVTATEYPQKNFVWFAAGRDVAAKDFDNLLTAFRKIRAENSNTELRIAGKPANHRSLETYDGAGVRWLGLCKDMPGTMAACDAFVLSSAWEGMPLIVGEAMAMQKPVVATDVGGVRELVGSTGILVRPKDPDTLYQAMLRIMGAAQEDRESLGRAARKRICDSFDMNAKADEWESLYARILRDADNAVAMQHVIT